MIVNSVHLTQQLWLAAAISAFGLTRFAIRRGAHRRWSNFRHGLAGFAVGLFVMGHMVFTAWRLGPSPAEVREVRDSTSCNEPR